MKHKIYFTSYYALSFGKKWLTLLLLTLSFHLSGQNAHFEFFQASEYLSSSNAWELMKDKDGFLWVLGQSVDRYDGYNFINIKAQEEVWENYHLNANDYEKSRNHIAHRTDDHFFFRNINSGKLDSINFKPMLSKDEIVNEWFFFYETANGQLFFFFFEPSTQKTTFLTLEEGQLKRKFFITDLRMISLPSTPSIVNDTKGNFYYLNKTGSHFIKIDKDGKLLQKIPHPSPSSIYDPAFLKSGPNNTLYANFKNKIFKLNENAEAFDPHPINQHLRNYSSKLLIYDLLPLSNGDLWICGQERTLISYSKATGKINDYTKELAQVIPNRETLTQLLSDETGVIWAKVQFSNILKVVPKQSLFDTYFTERDCEGFCSFRGMIEDDSGQILASFYQGIAQIEPVTKTSKYIFPHLPHLAPYGLGYDKGHLLYNTGERLNISTGVYDKNFSIIPDYHPEGGVMAQDNSGNWWSGHRHALWFYDASTVSPKWEKKIQMPMAGEYTYPSCIHFGATSKYLWVAQKHRLLYVDIATNKMTKIFEMPSQEIIHAIYEDHHKNIWLGTEDGFVMVSPKGKTLKRYHLKNGLPHQFVSGVLPEGDSCLWLGTNSGLSRFQIEKETFTNFYTEQGLSNNEFNRMSAFKAKDGQLFFGGVQGINAFYPQEVMQKYQRQQNAGKLILSAVSHVDEKQDTTVNRFVNLNDTSLAYYHWDKSITLEFCLTNFRNATKNQFSYLLEGYDKVWSTPSPYNFAKYNHLPAGDYVFRVKAIDARGNWNPNELTIPIKVYPPWWKTSWAYLAYVFILSVIFYGAYRIFKNRLELENQFKFEQKEAQRLKELDTFKSRLFTNLTHEFRTPLTVILGMSQQIAKSAQALKKEESLKKSILSQSHLIEKNGGTLLQLINQLLDLSKLENNALKITLQHGDIIPFLKYTVSSFGLYANQKNLVLKFSTPLDTLEMDFDPVLLQQVMVNLISNALKFTASEGKITVIAESVQQEGRPLLRISIKDSGIGIPTEKIPHIFDRFFQVDSSTTRAGEGTGIGLAHTKELVELMKGQIGVESTIGEGTLFWINLPIEQEYKEMGSKKVTSSFPNKVLVTGLEIPEKRIDKIADKEQKSDLPKLLLIEDNPDVVTYLKSCLENQYQMEVAYNGKVGIEKAIENIPDLILSDVMMPEKDGFEVLDHLKNDEKTSHIPIVLLTAKADFPSKINGLKRGADAYLSKPFVQEELEILLQALLQKQQRLIQYFSKEIKNETSIQAPVDLPQETIRIEHAFIQKIEKILEEHYKKNDFNLNHLCEEIDLSRSQLFRKMKALVGASPSSFIRSYRLRKAKILLETTELNVSEVAWETGFSNLSHFSRVFQEEFGLSPSVVGNTSI